MKRTDMCQRTTSFWPEIAPVKRPKPDLGMLLMSHCVRYNKLGEALKQLEKGLKIRGFFLATECFPDSYYPSILQEKWLLCKFYYILGVCKHSGCTLQVWEHGDHWLLCGETAGEGRALEPRQTNWSINYMEPNILKTGLNKFIKPMLVWAEKSLHSTNPHLVLSG